MNLRVRQVLLFFNWSLVGLSAISLIFVFAEAFKRSFNFSINGLANFFSLLSTFSILYGATFVVLTTIFTIDRLGIMQEANDNTWLSNSRAIWFQILKELIGEIKKDDNYMYRDFLTNSIRMHDYLFNINYAFTSKVELEKFYETFTKGQVCHYEKMNKSFVSNGYYKDINHSYSLSNYRFVVINILNSANCYPNWQIDIESIYMQEVRLFSTQHIDLQAYNFSLIRSSSIA